MEELTQEKIDAVNANWTKFKTVVDKIDTLVKDVNNCQSDTSKAILMTSANNLYNKMIEVKVF